MNDNEIDKELIAAYCLEINERFKRISELVPDSQRDMMKNLAAAAIHVALFAQHLSSEKENEKDYVKEFLNKCGCKKYAPE